MQRFLRRNTSDSKLACARKRADVNAWHGW